MKKPVTKIICAALASVVALGIASAAGCSGYSGKQLAGDTSGEISSNGGFAVEKGGYVYFINGVETNTADNTLGTPVKGAISRISVEDLNAANYASAEIVVPQIAYSSNYETGIFVYGDRVYYATPTTSVNSAGQVQNGMLDFKSCGLNGSDPYKGAYATLDLGADYRFVEEEGVVYLMYAAEGETLYGETSGVTNIHSVNTSTGADTLLAYNVSSYVFDAEDKSNAQIFYTMTVKNYAGDSNTDYGYNQVYTVNAAETEQNEYDFGEVLGWDGSSDRYINCGDLVFDGVGGPVAEKTVFNYKPDDAALKNDLSYTYALETLRGGRLFYTRKTDTSSEYLFSLKTDSITDSWDAIGGNPENTARLLDNGSSADTYKYVFGQDGELSLVIAAEGSGGISVNKVTGGKLAAEIDNKNYFNIVKEGTATLLFIDGDYIYYSLTGGNGYTFYRVSYKGEWHDYDGMTETGEVNDYKPVQILDLDADSSWYKPEIIENHILFASETDNMTSYNYIMAFDLADMDNAALDALNKKFEGILGEDGVIPGYADEDDYPTDIYANLADAARYLFYTSDIDYVRDLAAACNAELEEGDDLVYSPQTLEHLAYMMAPAADNEWADYVGDSKKVNGKDVSALSRDYYYSVLGTMTGADKTAYRDSFRTEYLRSWPEEEQVSWWEGLNTAAKVCFIIGMCLAGILVIGGITVGVIVIVRKARAKKQPRYARRRIRVDTTDDKTIDVYGDGEDHEESENGEEGEK